MILLLHNLASKQINEIIGVMIRVNIGVNLIKMLFKGKSDPAFQNDAESSLVNYLPWIRWIHNLNLWKYIGKFSCLIPHDGLH